jgi:hypothetical protein
MKPKRKFKAKIKINEIRKGTVSTVYPDDIEYEPPFEKEHPVRFPLFEHKYDDDCRNPCKNCPNFKKDEINICLCALPALVNPIRC